MSSGISETEMHTAVLVFAHYLGIDIDNDPEMIRIAEDALKNLPSGWELGIGEHENAGIPYFFNLATEKSVWKHPNEKSLVQIVRELKKRKANSGSSSPSQSKPKSPGSTGKEKRSSISEIQVDVKPKAKSPSKPIATSSSTIVKQKPDLSIKTNNIPINAVEDISSPSQESMKEMQKEYEKRNAGKMNITAIALHNRKKETVGFMPKHTTRSATTKLFDNLEEDKPVAKPLTTTVVEAVENIDYGNYNKKNEDDSSVFEENPLRRRNNLRKKVEVVDPAPVPDPIPTSVIELQEIEDIDTIDSFKQQTEIVEPKKYDNSRFRNLGLKRIENSQVDIPTSSLNPVVISNEKLHLSNDFSLSPKPKETSKNVLSSSISEVATSSIHNELFNLQHQLLLVQQENQHLKFTISQSNQINQINQSNEQQNQLIDELRLQLSQYENNDMLYTRELKEELINVNSKLNASINTLKISQSENNILKTQINTLLLELKGTNHNSLDIYSKLNQIELERNKLLHSNQILQTSNESLMKELNELKITSSTSINENEYLKNELLNYKQNQKYNFDKLHQKILELNEMNRLLQIQIDKSSILESESIHELELTIQSNKKLINYYKDNISEMNTKYLQVKEKNHGMINDISVLTSQLSHLKDQYEQVVKQLQDSSNEKNKLLVGKQDVKEEIEKKVKVRIQDMEVHYHRVIKDKEKQLNEMKVKFEQILQQLDVLERNQYIHLNHPMQPSHSSSIPSEKSYQKKALRRSSRSNRSNRSRRHELHHEDSESEMSEFSDESEDDREYSNRRHRKNKSHRSHSKNKKASSPMSKDTYETNNIATEFIQTQIDSMRQQLSRFLQSPVANNHRVSRNQLHSKLSSEMDDLFRSPQAKDYPSYIIPSTNVREDFDDLSFHPIQDGGYHENYWEVKYHSSN